MKNITIYLFLVLSIVALFGFAFTIAESDEPDGKKIFIDNKCNMCHTVKSFGIESKKSDAIDISQLQSDKDLQFWMNYLTKKEKLNGKEHKSSFKGSEEDLKKLIEWMMTFKSEK